MNTLYSFWPSGGSLLLRATLLLLLGLALTAFARRSPALRHRLGVLTFAALLLLPLLNTVLPPLNLDVYSRDVRPVPVAAVPPPATHLTSNPSTPNTVTPTQLPVASTVTHSPPSLSWAQIVPALILSLWGLGALLVLCRALLGLVAVRRLQSHESQRLESGPLAQQCAELARQVGVRRPVSLILANNHEVNLPMTWGWFSPQLLLPSAALNWSPERLRSVILHELSHIRRGDWAAQALATLVCALYWFHPLVWIAANRLKADAESATDERVVASGVKASDYCTHLLELARLAASGQGRPRYATYGIPMARHSKIEGRLRALLGASSPRRAHSKIASAMLLAVFASSFALLATLQIRLKAQSLFTKRTTAIMVKDWPGASTQNLPGGGSVALLGVSVHPSHGKAWWGPDGSPLPVNTFITGGATSSGSPGYKTREFVAMLRDIPKDSSWRWSTKPGTNWAAGQAQLAPNIPRIKETSQFIELSASIPENLSELSINIGVANGPWQTVAECASRKSSVDGANGHQVLFARGTETGGEATITVSHSFNDDDVRLVAVDLDGKEHSASHNESMGSEGLNQLTSSFQNLPLSRVKTFEFQTRPFHWVNFEHVALGPHQSHASTNIKPSGRMLHGNEMLHRNEIAWSAMTLGQHSGIGFLGISRGLPNAQGEIPIFLKFGGKHAGVLPVADWSKVQVSASGYPKPILGSNVTFRSVNITGWQPPPAGKKTGYTALVRYVRLLPAGQWTISISVPLTIEGVTKTYNTPVYRFDTRSND